MAVLLSNVFFLVSASQLKEGAVLFRLPLGDGRHHRQHPEGGATKLYQASALSHDFQANDYPLALPSGFTSFLSSWPLQVLFMSIKTPILSYDYSGSSRDQQKELYQRN